MIRSASPATTASLPAAPAAEVRHPVRTAPSAPDTVSNAPSTWPEASAPSSAVLMARIAEGDAFLCQWMAQRPTRCADPPGRQRVIHTIETLEELRGLLARRASTTLHRWLDELDSGARLDPGRLQLRIQHAGLTEVLRGMRVGELSPTQRLELYRVLRDVGSRPATLRALLGLSLEEADTPEIVDVESDAPHSGTRVRDFAPTLDLLLPPARATALQQATAALDASRGSDSAAARATRDACRERVRRLAAEAYQHAAMVNRRFGFTSTVTAWGHMASSSQRQPQVKLLESLSKPTAPAAQGHVPDIQLP
ncbi:hypothetical protein [Stenotrophomonas sp. 22385]|uniref:hypothetical protein n=1 Tax=Stenotrophomonas sp. 22385 TaxID=3453915 RepID=UPI003F867FDB